MIAAAAGVLLVLPGCGSGGESTRGASISEQKIEVVHKSGAAGVGIAQVVLPLTPGEFQEPPRVRTEFGKTCQVQPMGSRFEDGSLRYLRLEVPVDVVVEDRQTLELKYTEEADPEFELHPAVVGQIGVEARLRVGAGTQGFPAAELIESGPVTRVYRSRLRVPGSMMWAELTTCMYSGLPFARFTLQWGASNPAMPDLHATPGEVEFQVRGADVEFEVQSKLLARAMKSGYDCALLHKVGSLGDGQSNLLDGYFVYAGSSPPRIFALSRTWAATETFGPFGTLLPEIGVDPVKFAALVERNEGDHVDHPWAPALHGCNPEPTSTGDQADFGTIVMREDLVLADPSRLASIRRSVYQEACRSTHHREADVRPVTVADHPRLLTLNGRAKDEGRNPDLLGKPAPGTTGMMRATNGQNWHGHDTEHLSVNYLAALALVTGDRFAREEIAHHAMLYLTGFTYNSGSWNDTMGPARKVGRSTLAAIWIWLVTGREDVRTRVEDRARELRAMMLARTEPAFLALPVIAPRGGAAGYWSVWEEANAVTGLAAVYHHFHTREALDALLEVGRSVTMHGYGKLSDGSWRVTYQAPFKNASGGTYVALEDPEFDSEAAGGGITVWAVPALVIVVDLHPESAVRDRGLEILEDLLSGPTDGLDTVLRWMCVSPRASSLAGMRGQP